MKIQSVGSVEEIISALTRGEKVWIGNHQYTAKTILPLLIDSNVSELEIFHLMFSDNEYQNQSARCSIEHAIQSMIDADE